MKVISRALLASLLCLGLLNFPVAAQAPSGAKAPAAAAKSQPKRDAQTAPGEEAETEKPPPSPENQALLASLEEARKSIEDIETSVADPKVTGEQLQELRARLDPITDRLRELITATEPKLDAARVRLNQLGPKPKDGAEGPDVARDRAEREAGVNELDESLKIARALLVQAEQLTTKISDSRRATFARALFQRSYSVLSPELWLSAIKSFPRDLRAMQQLAGDAWWQLEYVASSAGRLLLGLALVAGFALHLARRRIVPRIVSRDAAASSIKPSRKLRAAFAVLVVETVPAALASFIIYQTIVGFDLVPYRATPLTWAFLAGIAFLAFMKALIDAIFSSDAPAWRLLDVPDRVASAVLGLGTTFASVVVIGRIVDALNQSIAAALPLTIAAKAVTAILAAATLALLLYRLSVQEVDASDEASLGPYVPTSTGVSGPVRLAGWVIVAAVVVATLGGYVAFSSFLLDQVVWTATIAGILYLALTCCTRFVSSSLSENNRVATAIQTNLGLRRKALQQLAVIASGVVQAVLWIIAAMVALAPWGIESGDIASSLKAAFFGFKVGDVTISLSTVIVGLLIFAGLIGLTRIVQRWLTSTFLPTTELDAGLRNSISTAAGYLGFFAAASAAFSFLGFSLERIAILAGALSVGIGFGLQSIVNNFVSGLILLWERPIKVGDLVVVGSDEGYVRKISVRATEIETFERSTIIVPNSNLISGTVKNRMRQDVTGRILLPIKVLRNQDPARAAELLIEECAAHPDVMEEPAPRVLFKKIGEAWLEFDLICFVPDIGIKARVESDLNFSILKSLSAAGIFPPLSADGRKLEGLEPLQEALEHIARALAERDGTRARKPASANAAE